jgi:hypothetical protein
MVSFVRSSERTAGVPDVPMKLIGYSPPWCLDEVEHLGKQRLSLAIPESAASSEEPALRRRE